MDSFGKTLLVFALLHVLLLGLLAYYSRYLLPSYFCIPLPVMKSTSFFVCVCVCVCVLVLEGLVGLHRTIQLQLLRH